MGRKCRAGIWITRAALAAFILGSPAPARAQNTGILPPDNPPLQVVPPEVPEDQLQKDLERRREENQWMKDKSPPAPAAEKGDGLAPVPVKTPVKEHPPGPSRLMMAINLSVPKIMIKGVNRKNYTAEPTMIFHAAIRLDAEPKGDGLCIFSGLRVAPFSGKGNYQDRGGTYGFVYFGPMIGVGKISRASAKDPALDEAERIGVNEEKEPDETPSRNGWLALGGIAAQSRFANYDRGYDPPAEDFNTKSVSLDPPGFWGEFMYTRTYLDAISLTGLGGVQLGKNKVFVYLGIGTGLWY